MDDRTASPLSLILARRWPRDAGALCALRDFAGARMRMLERMSCEWVDEESRWAYARAVEWAGRLQEIEKELRMLPCRLVADQSAKGSG